MAGWNGIGRLLIITGLTLAIVGVLLTLVEKWPSLGAAFGWVGKLPGDLSITRERFSLYVPIATSLVLSILLSVALYILSWLFRR
ncbi:MAG: DUF2905 domain-containing protein [Nitrospira sp.]|jgi:hypothetical protein|nr:DUF2905 domain-containing protein [Nitrospira sp.]